jgi:LysM repeat protein
MNNYYDLLINQETGRYVFRLLSFKQIMENPETYGFYVDRKLLYKPYRLRHIKVTSTISDLTAWSIGQKINYKILKQYNPWLRKNSLTVTSGKVYHIAIPKDHVDLSAQDDEPLMQSDTLLSDSAMSDKFQENDPNLVDATPIQSNYTATAEVKGSDVGVSKAAEKPVVNQQATASPEVIIHTVKNGESLARIAKKYKVKIIDIIILNDLDIDKPLKLGRQIRIK